MSLLLMLVGFAVRALLAMVLVFGVVVIGVLIWDVTVGPTAQIAQERREARAARDARVAAAARGEGVAGE